MAVYINVYCVMNQVGCDNFIKNLIWSYIHHFPTRNINLGNNVFIIARAKEPSTLPSSLSQGPDSCSGNKIYCHQQRITNSIHSLSIIRINHDIPILGVICNLTSLFCFGQLKVRIFQHCEAANFGIHVQTTDVQNGRLLNKGCGTALCVFADYLWLNLNDSSPYYSLWTSSL